MFKNFNIFRTKIHNLKQQHITQTFTQISKSQESAKNINSISAEIDNAFKYAKESPFPDQHILNDHIYMV